MLFYVHDTIFYLLIISTLAQNNDLRHACLVIGICGPCYQLISSRMLMQASLSIP